MRFGLAFRLGIVLAAVGMLAAGLSAYYAHELSRELLVQSAKKEMLTATQVLARRITIARQGFARDLLFLARHPAAQATLMRNDPAQATQLAVLFRELMQVSPGYFQMRLISAADYGLERVRVDRDSLGPLRVQGEELQEKGHYPYVFEALALQPGQIYLSSIHINRERGTHAAHEQPTALMATPVADAAGKALGVLVINVDLVGMFTLLQADLPADYRLFLANRDGDYLIHPDPEKRFAFERGRRELMQADFPSTATLVDGTAAEVVLEVAEDAYGGQSMIAAFIAHAVDLGSERRQLIVGLGQPLANVLGEVNALRRQMLWTVLGLSLGLALFALALARAVTRPINQLSRAVQRFGEAHESEGLPLARQDEIGSLARSFHHMRQQIREHLGELESSRRELAHQARHDALTDLPNRALFADRVNQAIAVARREGLVLALVFIDLDEFKPINDALGHAVGDEVLRLVATRLLGVIRASDTAARIGGDEFVVLLRSVRGRDEALAVADKLRLAIAQPMRIDDHALQLTASLGLAMFPDDGDDPVALARQADEAMYRVKQGGRNAVGV